MKAALGFLVRRAAPEDAAAVVSVIERVAHEGRWIRTEAPLEVGKRVEAFRADLASGNVVSFVAENAAGAIVAELSVFVEGPRGTIAMCVEQNERSQGMGRALVDAAISWARSSSLKEIALEVYAHNDAAIALYEARGFVESGERTFEKRANGESWESIPMVLALA
jgi:ribosomal protein S18 acetylase RimI-like enzyme